MASSIGESEKRIVLIRHGCTHMNEYLSTPGTRWGDPTFVDDWRFRDTKLSSRGIQEAKQLHQKFAQPSSDQDEPHQLHQILPEVELIVVSPLQRALQTLEIGLYSHFKNSRSPHQPAIVATPYASERVYLTSDVGSHIHELQEKYQFVDFESGFHPTYHPPHEWWWTPDISSVDKAPPREWRPFGQGQKYVNAGEPERSFHRRMQKLYDWLDSRKEQTIVLISHWGVIQYLSGHDFQNCEVKVMPFAKLRRHGSGLTAEEMDSIFIKGERSIPALKNDEEIQ